MTDTPSDLPNHPAEPGMIGTPPSARHIPYDSADHAEDFSHRYAEDLDIATGQVMMDLNLTDHQMGARDPDRNREHHTFFPSDRTGGSVSPTGQITIDSGVMNLHLLDAGYYEPTQEMWRRTKLRSRIEAIIPHELAETEYKDHDLALIAAPETKLPISHEAKRLLRTMEAGWKGSAGPSSL